MPAADYEHLLRATAFICDDDHSQVAAMFRLAAFNVAACNEDDHLRNIAWLVGDDGRWRVAPGFDLTYAPSPAGERWTTVVGVGRGIGRASLLELASRVGLRPQLAAEVLDEVTTATAAVRDHLATAACDGPVSRAAADAVECSTARLR